MKIVVTCGPSYEPIDGARRMTNMSTGKTMSSPKFATRDGRIHLVLAPATKILPRMRNWFPDARIVGWKYELAGTRDDAFAKAWKQLRDCQTDACVLNGAAYGEGFALCHEDGRVETAAQTPGLCALLNDWLQRGPSLVEQPRRSPDFFCKVSSPPPTYPTHGYDKRDCYNGRSFYHGRD